MKLLSLTVAAIALTLGACERHSWEDTENEDGDVTKGTKRLFTGHDQEESGEKKDH